MRLHVEALFVVDDQGRLVSINDGSAAAAPRFFLGCTPDGNVWAARRDLPSALIERLCAAAAEERADLDLVPSPERLTPYLELLAIDAPVARIWTGPTYRFPAKLADSSGTIRVTSSNVDTIRPYLEAWSEDVLSDAPVTAALEDGSAVAVCASVRVTAHAHEAGVETHPDFRRRGHAARAVAGWAQTVLEAARLPLYSTSWENEASLRLAKRLGLIQYGSVVHLT